MKTNVYLRTWVLLAVFHFVIPANAQRLQPVPTLYSQKLSADALLFMENRGQVADERSKPQPQILFTSNSNDAKIFITATGIHYQFNKTDSHKESTGSKGEKQGNIQRQILQSTYRFSLVLQGANPQPKVCTQQQSLYTENYYLPHCPDGITNVRGYQKIILQNVYPNIDWVLYSKGGFMEYDFLVHQGGNPANIRLKVKDVEKVSITPQGELLMETALGEVREKAPVSYVDGRKVATRFKQFQDGTIGFDVKPQPGKELRIDPSVTWATYYGGSGRDFGYSCTTDASGNVYLAGTTTSTSGIASGGFQNTYNGGTYNGDAFLVKFGPGGSRLLATYYGGAGEENSRGCATDASGNVYLAGITTSTDNIAAGGFQNTQGDGGGYNDGFLVKFSSSGSRLWATYYGGTDEDNVRACATDGSGNIYLAGYTLSANAISFNGFQNAYSGGHDGFLAKFAPDGSRLWATYFGDTGYDIGAACATDASGNVYLAGQTNSTANIASGGFQNTQADGGVNRDAYLAKFSPGGSRIWATYYGGTNYDYGYACTTDGSGNVYLAGQTSSASGISFNGFQNTYSGNYADAFLAKFNSDGTRQWATYYGGNYGAYGASCATDAGDNVFLAGFTTSTNNIAADGFQNAYGGGNADAFLVKLNSSGNRVWGSYYGGSGQDEGSCCTVDASSNVYLTGSTQSGAGIASGGFQNTYGGTSDAFLAKIDNSTILPLVITLVKAYQQADNIQVEWAVQQESSIKGYEIEKSLDGSVFSKAGERAAAGNPTYQWLDVHATAGNNFYRIKSMERDGRIKYSPVVKVVISKGSAAYQVYPNPVTGNSINLSFINQPKGTYTVRLLNAALQVVLSKKISHTEGSSSENIYMENSTAKGSYLLEVTGPDGNKQTFKIVY